jgi:hypothetical protein
MCLQFNQNLGSGDAEMLAKALNYMSQLTTLNLVRRVMASIEIPNNDSHADAAPGEKAPLAVPVNAGSLWH